MFDNAWADKKRYTIWPFQLKPLLFTLLHSHFHCAHYHWSSTFKIKPIWTLWKVHFKGGQRKAKIKLLVSLDLSFLFNKKGKKKLFFVDHKKEKKKKEQCKEKWLEAELVSKFRHYLSSFASIVNGFLTFYVNTILAVYVHGFAAIQCVSGKDDGPLRLVSRNQISLYFFLAFVSCLWKVVDSFLTHSLTPSLSLSLFLSHSLFFFELERKGEAKRKVWLWVQKRVINKKSG